MKSKIFNKVLLGFAVILISTALSGYDAFMPEDTSDPRENFFKLQNLYFNWQKGLYGSRGYYRARIRSFLIEMINNEIQTMDDYFLVTPESIYDKKVKCKLRMSRWLYVHGPVDVSEIKKLIKEKPLLLKKWWRSTELFSVKGRLKKYKISRDANGDVIDLHFYKIKIIYKHKNGKKEVK